MDLSVPDWCCIWHPLNGSCRTAKLSDFPEDIMFVLKPMDISMALFLERGADCLAQMRLSL